MFAGKFVYYYGKEGCQKGHIIEQTDNHVLIRWDRMRGDPSPHDAAAVCIAIATMVTDPERDADWQFFQTRDELDAHHLALDSEDDLVQADKALDTAAVH